MTFSCLHLVPFLEVYALGSDETIKGEYAIVDGGYHEWLATMSASLYGQGIEYTEWLERLESVGKDIECGAFAMFALVPLLELIFS